MTNETKTPEALLTSEGFQIIFASCIINELKLFVTQKLCNWNMFALYVADNYQGTLEKKESTFRHFLFGRTEKVFHFTKTRNHMAWHGRRRRKPTANSQQCGSKGVNKFYFQAICLAGVHRCFRSCLGTPCSTHKTSKSN